MLALALLIVAANDPNGVDVGVTLGATASLPPMLFADGGGFAQLRVDSFLVRTDVNFGVSPLGDVQTAQASVIAAWVFALPLDDMDVFAGGGPAVGFLRSAIDALDVPGPRPISDASHGVRAGFGGVGVFGYELHATPALTLVSTVSMGVEAFEQPFVVATINGGAALHF